MLTLTVWLMLMGAGTLFYPKRPHVTCALFVVAGAFTLVVWLAGALGNNPPFIAATSAVLGFGFLWRFRDRAIREARVTHWSGRSAR